MEKELPTLVVGISTHREAEHIGRTIESVWKAKLPEGIKRKRMVIFANDDDEAELRKTVEAAERKLRELGIPAYDNQIISSNYANRPHAVNQLMQHAWVTDHDTKALALVTGDVLVKENAFQRMYLTLTSRMLDGVGAHITPSSKSRFAQALADIPHRVAGFRHIDGKCMMLTPEAVGKIGEIPENVLNDDTYISAKLGADKISHAAGAFVTYHPPKNMREWYSQALRQWKGVLQARKMFGRKVIDELVNPSVAAAFAKGIKEWNNLGVREKAALLAAPLLYGAVKAVAALGKSEGGTWNTEKTTKKE